MIIFSSITGLFFTYGVIFMFFKGFFFSSNGVSFISLHDFSSFSSSIRGILSQFILPIVVFPILVGLSPVKYFLKSRCILSSMFYNLSLSFKIILDIFIFFISSFVIYLFIMSIDLMPFLLYYTKLIYIITFKTIE
jgi:hypothetical protein